MNRYKLKENLFLVGNKIISYETCVATIKDGVIIENGRYSRTTTKHIHYVSRLTGFPVESSKVKKSKTFYKYEMGVKIEMERFISPKTSIKILTRMKEGSSYDVAVASLKREISEKDWNLLDKPKTLTDSLIKAASILTRIDAL